MSSIIEQLTTYSPITNSDAERGVLGCIMLDHRALGEVQEAVTAEAFHDLRNRLIWDTIQDLLNESIPIDTTSVVLRLKRHGKLEEAGGAAALMSMVNEVASADHAAMFAEELVNAYDIRRAQLTAMEIESRAQQGVDANELLAFAEGEVNSIRRESGKSFATIRDIMHQSISHLEAVYTGDSNAGIGTGFYDLDNLTGGLHPNEMCVVAARPGVGKTALALNIAAHVALHLKQPVGFFSMEMSNVQLGLRLLSSASSVNIRQVEQRKCKVEVAAAKLTGAVTLFKDAPLYVDDSSMLNISQIRSRARRMVEQFGVKLFIIDYLQFIQSARRSDNRASDVAVISAGLKNIAKELNVPVMVMCQLNRESEKYQRAPRLSDLRESGSIEQDADTVITLHHEEEGVCVTIAKQRNGPMGQFRLTWIPEYTRFENYSPASESSYAQNDQ